jgi:tetratricopeptide (TPR) repeat protein
MNRILLSFALCWSFLILVQPAAAQDAKGAACVAGSKAAPARVIADCDALLADKTATDANVTDIYLARADAHVRQGRPQLAIADLDNAIKRSAADARLFAHRAELYRWVGEHERSLTESNESIRLDPGKADVFRGRGNAFHALNQFDRAIEDYNEALRLDPKNAQAFSDRGAAWYFKKEPRAAIRDYDEAVRLEPANPYMLSNRAAAWKDLGEMDHALGDESEAIRIAPSEPEFWSNRGLSYALNKDYDRAIADYNLAIQLKPRASFLTNRGDAFQAKGDLDRAIADYDEAIKRDADFWKAWNNRGAAWRRKGDRRRALSDFEAALRANPSAEEAIASRRLLVREIEQLGAMMPVDNKPSFNCGAAKRAVEKAICGDPGLTQLDREIDLQFRKTLTKLDARRADALRKEQAAFITSRNASFGRPDYDFRGTLEKRLTALRAMAN